jgi:hypothetical protein
MSEPIKVNAYYKVSTFLIGKERWWILKSGKGVILTRPDNVFAVDKAAGVYSLLYDKTSSFKTLKVEGMSLIVLEKDRIVVISKGGLVNDSTHKENVAKI